MSTQENQPSPSRKAVERDVGGHRVKTAFYPGFVSAVQVNGEPVYTQATDGPNPFVLPAGSNRPWTNSVFEIESGNGYRFSIQLEDPDHVVASIQVTLHARETASVEDGVSVEGGLSGEATTQDGGAGGVALEAAGDVVTILNTPVLCPPHCPEVMG